MKPVIGPDCLLHVRISSWRGWTRPIPVCGRHCFSLSITSCNFSACDTGEMYAHLPGFTKMTLKMRNRTFQLVSNMEDVMQDNCYMTVSHEYIFNFVTFEEHAKDA